MGASSGAVAVVMPPIDRLAPWVALAVWWIALTRFRRRRPWLRSLPLTVGLIVATLFADALVIVASSRMSAPGGRTLATFVLWVAAVLSVTTYAILRTPSGGGGLGRDRLEGPPRSLPLQRRAGRNQRRARSGRHLGVARLRHDQRIRLSGRPGRGRDHDPRGPGGGPPPRAPRRHVPPQRGGA